jgi:tripartite-type tricarboxylate transporter receptor subunit TctC
MPRIFASSVRGALLATLALVGTAADAQTFPTKPVRIISPYAPGGSTSVVARLVAARMTESWGHQVLVDNRPGAATKIGTEAMVRSPADGHTLLMVTSTITINPSLMKLPYDTVRDIAALGTVTTTGFMLVVHPALPVKTLRDFVSLAKSRPGQLDYGSSGTGTANHVAMELFSQLADIRMQHIPYKGGGPAMIDLLAGQVQVHLNVPTNLIPNVKNGRVKGIAVTGDARMAALPDLPTFAEAGLPRFDSTNWNGLYAPAGTPKPIVDRIAAELARILQLPDVRANLLGQGLTPWITSPEEHAALVKREIETFGKVIKAAGIRIE